MTIDTQKLRQAAASVRAFLKPEYGREIAAAADIIEALEGQVAEYARLAEQTRTEADVRIDAQTAEIARLREAQAWRPIETAPQGQIALFYDANATEVRGCMFVDWMVGGAFCGNRHHVATHWMSLPAAPSALSGESK